MKKYSFIVLFVLLAAFQAGISNTECFAADMPAKITYQSPVAGAEYVMPATTIIIRVSEKVDRASLARKLFSVTGTASGRHTGSIILSDDERTVIFKPDYPFMLGETVTASVSDGIRTDSGEEAAGTSFNFHITKISAAQRSQANVSEIMMKEMTENISSPQTHFTSAPKANSASGLPSDFPPITITLSNNPSDGYIFLSNFAWEPNIYSCYLMILDNTGYPVFYKKMPSA